MIGRLSRLLIRKISPIGQNGRASKFVGLALDKVARTRHHKRPLLGRLLTSRFWLRAEGSGQTALGAPLWTAERLLLGVGAVATPRSLTIEVVVAYELRRGDLVWRLKRHQTRERRKIAHAFL